MGKFTKLEEAVGEYCNQLEALAKAPERLNANQETFLRLAKQKNEFKKIISDIEYNVHKKRKH